jgi:hypothetical protein
MYQSQLTLSNDSRGGRDATVSSSFPLIRPFDDAKTGSPVTSFDIRLESVPAIAIDDDAAIWANNITLFKRKRKRTENKRRFLEGLWEWDFFLWKICWYVASGVGPTTNIKWKW